jgi:hypothetical protein
VLQNKLGVAKKIKRNKINLALQNKLRLQNKLSVAKYTKRCKIYLALKNKFSVA